MEPRVIGICGNGPGVGKSTLAEYLRDYHGYFIVKFARPLKAMMRALFVEAGYSEGAAWDMIEGEGKEIPLPESWGGKTPRYLMQTLGTEWGRMLVSDAFWVELGKRQVLREWRGGNVVVDDMRFVNEEAALREGFPNFTSVYVHRPDFGAPTGHVSEGGIKAWHCNVCVPNNQGLNSLYQWGDLIARRHLNAK